MASIIIPDKVEGLNLSLSMIQNAKNNESKVSKTFYKDIEKKFLTQAEEEKEFLSHNRWACPPSVEDSIIEKTKDMHTIDLSRKESDNMFLDSRSLETLACVANNITLFDGPNLRTGYNFIRKLITDVRMIGAPSVNGVVMSGTMYDKYKDLIVIKAPKEYDDYTEEAINHELVVGKVLNSLRSIIPNFAFVLGSFECGPPVIKPSVGNDNTKDKLITWCRGGTKVKYIMYENISGSKTLYDFCKDCSAQDYIDIIIQINYALMIAYKEVGFTHYDLHGENILVKKIKGNEEGAYIPYGGDFIFAKNLAMFIDYGYSHVYLPDSGNSVGYKPDTGPSGNVGLYPLGFYIDRPSPLADCYRILEATLGYMKSRNPEAYKQAYGLMYYFHPKDEDLSSIYRTKDASMIPIYGDSEYSERAAKFRYEDFILYCRYYCRENDMEDPVVSGKEYDQELDDTIIFAPNSMNIVKPSGQELNLNIENIDELFDIIEPVLIYKKYISNDSKHITGKKRESYDILLNKIYSSINKQKNRIDIIVKNEIDYMIETLNDMKMVDYRSIPRNDVYTLRTPMILKEYLDTFEKTVNHLDTMDFIERRIEMLKFVSGSMDLQLKMEIIELERLFKSKDERRVLINFLRNDMRSIGDYIDTKRNPDKIDSKINTVLDSMLSVIPQD